MNGSLRAASGWLQEQGPHQRRSDRWSAWYPARGGRGGGAPDAAVAVGGAVQQGELQESLRPALQPLVVRQRRRQRLQARSGRLRRLPAWPSRCFLTAWLSDACRLRASSRAARKAKVGKSNNKAAAIRRNIVRMLGVLVLMMGIAFCASLSEARRATRCGLCLFEPR